MKLSFFLLFRFCMLFNLATAQQAKPAQAPPQQRPPWLDTPEVHPDSSVTFRFLAPNAQEVKLAREGSRSRCHEERRQGRLDRDHGALAS